MPVGVGQGNAPTNGGATAMPVGVGFGVNVPPKGGDWSSPGGHVLHRSAAEALGTPTANAPTTDAAIPATLIHVRIAMTIPTPSSYVARTSGRSLEIEL
jgi:hypothetical protein